MTHHPSFPCTISVDYSGGTAFSQIGQVRDIGGPELEREVIDVPPHHGLPDNFKRFFAGVSDGGEVAFPVNWDWGDNSHIGDAGTGLKGSFEDTYNGTSNPRWQYQNVGADNGTATWEFRGFTTNLNTDTGAVQGHADAEVTVKIDGKPSLTIS